MWMEWISSFSPIRFVPLTLVTSRNIFDHILVEFFPPVITFNWFLGSTRTWMSCEQSVMVSPNYFLTECCVRGDPQFVFVHPKTLTGFQPVSTDFIGRRVFGSFFYLFF